MVFPVENQLLLSHVRPVLLNAIAHIPEQLGLNCILKFGMVLDLVDGP